MSNPPSRQPKKLLEEINQEFSQISTRISQYKRMVELGTEVPTLTDMELLSNLEGLIVELKRFSHFGVEFTRLFVDLLRRAKIEIEQLKTIRLAVELKNKELERLQKIDTSATALEKLMKDYKEQKERFEIQMASQRKIWEEERAQRIQETQKFLELLMRWQQNEKEKINLMKLAEEKSSTQTTDEEKLLLHELYTEKQKALIKDFGEQEPTVNKNDAESTLVRDLEKFAASLHGRLKRNQPE